VREKPSFDDIELPPVVTTPIDGMTDEQWAARLDRRERRWRMAFGAVFGTVVGTLALFPVWPWTLWRVRPGLSFLFVVAGCAILFAALFAQRRDHEALEHARWILMPEWYLVEKLPVWVLALVLAAGLAAVILFVGVFAAGWMLAGR
jgi:hypothetical protein